MPEVSESGFRLRWTMRQGLGKLSESGYRLVKAPYSKSGTWSCQHL